MNRRRLLGALLSACGITASFVVPGAFDLERGWHVSDAQAIDLFGSTEDPAAAPIQKIKHLN